MIRFVFSCVLAVFVAIPASAEIEIQEVTSPGGITAWLVEEHSIPFAAIEIRFKGGASLDAPGKRGAINLMSGLLEEGAADLDARGFAKAREALAASYEFAAYDDAMSISAKFLSENRDDAIELLRTAIIEPRFDEDALERVRAQVLSGVKSDAQDPNTIASQTFDRLAFGDHPYGSSRDGTVESVTALTRADIVAAHQTLFARDRLFVGAVGDITPEQLGAVLDTLFDDLPASSGTIVETAEYLLEGGLTLIPFDTPQSVALMGHEGILRDDEDFFAAYVANEIFGGAGFQSRLMEEVRIKRGLTYGIGAYLVPMDHGSQVLSQVASGNERMADALDVVRAEWERIANEGVTEDELEAAKTFLTGAYPLRFDGNGPIARIMVGMQVQGLPIDYIATRNDKVNAVTLDDIKRVAKRIYRPEDLHIVVVGQPEGIEASN
jgi:zinc protease